MLSTTTILFGMPPAHVEHDCCAALGAPECTYRITWRADLATDFADSGDQLASLRGQLEGMQERLHSMFATASDLIAADDVSDVLARITDRAALEAFLEEYDAEGWPPIRGVSPMPRSGPSWGSGSPTPPSACRPFWC